MRQETVDNSLKELKTEITMRKTALDRAESDVKAQYWRARVQKMEEVYKAFKTLAAGAGFTIRREYE